MTASGRQRSGCFPLRNPPVGSQAHRCHGDDPNDRDWWAADRLLSHGAASSQTLSRDYWSAGGELLGIGMILAAMLAQTQAVPAKLNEVIACGRSLAESATPPFTNALQIATQASAQCDARYPNAIADAVSEIQKSSSADDKHIRANIMARIRAEAFSSLIARLESMQVPSTALENATSSVGIIKLYAQCVRLSTYRKLDSVYLGDDFVSHLSGKDQITVDAFFASVTNADCPLTRARAVEATNTYLLGDGITDVGTRRRAVENSIFGIETDAVRPLIAGLLSAN